MTVRHARCQCGRVALECRGEPVRVSICHCDDCRRRTGSAFGVQVRFAQDATIPSGEPAEYVRIADSGRASRHRFCPACGTTVWWTMERDPGLAVVAGGTLADRALPRADGRGLCRAPLPVVRHAGAGRDRVDPLTQCVARSRCQPRWRMSR